MTPEQTKLLEDLRSGAVRLVPGEATAYVYDPGAGSAMDKLLWARDRQAVETDCIRRGGSLTPLYTASPDITPALVEMAEGLVWDLDKQTATALTLAQARIRELEEAIWLAHDQLNTYRSAAVEEVIDKLEAYIPGLSGKEAQP